MLKIGLTGGIGTGKSTISSIIIENGFKLIDADIISKEVLLKYPEILERVRIDFGEGFFDWRGEFRRKEFGNHIFRFPIQRKKFENLILPFIKKEIDLQIEDYKNKGEKLVFIDAPTLIETNLHEEMDYVVLVFADNATQISRIKLRDKLSNTDALNRINSQMPLEKKKEFANIIIDNNKDLESTKNQVDEVIEFFKSFI